jgi:hypothetical protein
MIIFLDVARFGVTHFGVTPRETGLKTGHYI